MAEDGGFADAESVEQVSGVGGEQVEAVVDIGLRRFAPADLVGDASVAACWATSARPATEVTNRVKRQIFA